MNEEHKNCKYRFKGKSCKDCPLNCKFKRLEQENKELKERLCETKQFLKNDREESSKFCQQIEAYQLSENEAKEIIAELKHKNKRLQEGNKRLQMLSCANCGEKYLSPEGAELYEKNVQLQEENEELKKQLEFSRTHKAVLDAERIKYEQALEEIKIAIGEKYGLADIIKIRTILDEVLNDRD